MQLDSARMSGRAGPRPPHRVLGPLVRFGAGEPGGNRRGTGRAHFLKTRTARPYHQSGTTFATTTLLAPLG